MADCPWQAGIAAFAEQTCAVNSGAAAAAAVAEIVLHY